MKQFSLVDVSWTSTFSNTVGGGSSWKMHRYVGVNLRENSKKELYKKPTHVPRASEAIFGIAIETFGIIGPIFRSLLLMLEEELLSTYMVRSMRIDLTLLIPKFLYLAMV